ncbi:gag-pol polyprotein [Cucumis melo var. makuwa]|uniref:Gag-pol polyprotein n=1 Tax=Cucumis melo var. makuwa TaxID=1194695 RepID=A0A5A7VQY1_CUCMM|nr:gag-pol polyprotein [Cucumis melo var. makuwa]TYK21055.1 gag-pol polyprotein [Cucumis melo var. makuwa]
MTRNASFFSELRECNVGSVMMCDKEKGKIIGKGTIDQPGLPYILNVKLGKGLSANLISISDLCDQGYSISFSKDRCNVMNSQNQTEEATLWHKRLGHISVSTISKTINADAIMGLPILSFDVQGCYGPMQNESLGGKRYAMLVAYTTKSLSDLEQRAPTMSNGKWDSKFDREIFLGYSMNSRAYRVYNQRTMTVMKSINVIVDDHNHTTKCLLDEEDGLLWVDQSQATRPTVSEDSSLTEENSYTQTSNDNIFVLVTVSPVDNLETS